MKEKFIQLTNFDEKNKQVLVSVNQIAYIDSELVKGKDITSVYFDFVGSNNFPHYLRVNESLDQILKLIEGE